MPVVDAHCHVSPVYFEPVECLLFQMDRNSVDRAVLIQMREQYQNAYQSECLRRYPDRFASVVVVNTEGAHAAQQLERLAEAGACGVRLRADVRSPGADAFEIWRAAERLGLAVSCSGSSALFASEDFARLVQVVPSLRIVLEHLAGQHRVSAHNQAIERAAATDEAYPDLGRVLRLASFPNVYVKIPGLGEFCERAMPVDDSFAFVRPIPPLLDHFCAAFGADRLMWGSDYPPVSTREGYANALRWPKAELTGRTNDERDRIFGTTALSVFSNHR